MRRLFDSRHRLMTGLTACGLIVIGLWWHVQRCERQVAQLRQEAARLETALRAIPQRSAEQVQLYREIDAARRVRQRWIGNATAERPAHATISHIMATARQSELTLLRFEPLPADSLNAGHWQPIRFSVRGTFPGLQQFLQELEALDQPLRFDHLSVAGGEAVVKSEPVLAAEITLRIFHAAENSSEIAGNAESVARKAADNYR